VTIEEYNNIKDLYSGLNERDLTNVDIGFITFYLNRCNRSGILGSGPIGGYDQNGKWKIDARFNKKDLISRIEKIYKYRNSISIYNEDAISFLRYTLPNINIEIDKTLIYLDPPYYEQGPKLYRTYYNNNQHNDLKEYLMNEMKLKWVLSYDNVSDINELYRDYNINEYSKNHFINKAKVGKEIIILSDNCKSPFGYER